jgi:protein gp37
MPDGSRAACYAKDVAEGVAQSAYPGGFKNTRFITSRLAEPGRVKEPAGIFLDSMSDLMGIWNTQGQIEQVLDVCSANRQHTFFLLTKNAPRLVKFTFPKNVWVGVSSPPDQMYGRVLSQEQRGRYLAKAFDVLGELTENGNMTWMSFEPLSGGMSNYVASTPNALQWAVIGAASQGKRLIPPDEQAARFLVNELDRQKVPVFFKGNLRSLKWAADNWRAEFPSEAKWTS